MKIRVQHQLGPNRTSPQFGPCQVQVIPPLETVVAELVALRHPEAPRSARCIHHVHARDLRFLAAIVRVFRYRERFAMGPQIRAATLIEPLGRNADGAGRRLPLLHAPLVHAHAVRQRLCPGMHGVAIGRALGMRQPGAAQQTTRGFIRMIHRG